MRHTVDIGLVISAGGFRMSVSAVCENDTNMNVNVKVIIRIFSIVFIIVEDTMIKDLSFLLLIAN
jgi:hypothetical protein